MPRQSNRCPPPLEGTLPPPPAMMLPRSLLLPAVLLAVWLPQAGAAAEAPKAEPAQPATPPAAAPAPAEAPQGEAYEIKFVRPMAVGYRFREKTTARYETQQTRETGGEAKPISAEAYTVRLDCSQDVLEVTPKGSPKAYRLEFHELVRKDDKGKEHALLPPGTVVMGRATDAGSTFTVEGKPVGEDLSDTLEDLFGMSVKDLPTTMDDVYGSAEKRRVGERWSINAEKAKDWFDEPNLNPMIGLADPTMISGESTVLKRHPVGGVDCLQVGHTVSVRRMQTLFILPNPAGPRRPIELQSIQAMKVDLPLDKSLQERGYTSYKRNRQIVQQDADANDRVVAVVESTYRTELEPLPPKQQP